MNRVPVFYTTAMAVESGGYSPSAMKPRLVMNDWARRFPLDVRGVEPATPRELCRVHSKNYVDGVLGGTISNGHYNQNREVAESCLYMVGSFMGATREAIRNGKVAVSPTSGFHHAGWHEGGGFCTFNGLMAAAIDQVVGSNGRRVAILDLDAHYGDGTDDIIDRLSLKGSVMNWTFGRDFTSKRTLAGQIAKFIESAVRSGVGVLMYQAGADPHEDDPLGYGDMSTRDLKMRDRTVFREAKIRGLPVVWNLAGGYQRNELGEIPVVLEIHRNTMAECVSAYCETEFPVDKELVAR